MLREAYPRSSFPPSTQFVRMERSCRHHVTFAPSGGRRPVPDQLRRTAISWVSRGATISAGSMLPTGTSRIRRRRRPDPREHQAAGSGQGRDVGVGEDRAEEYPDHGEHPLDDRDRQCGHQDADPERRGEGQRGEAVEDRLEGELLDAPAESVGDAAEDGERADAEQQRRREPSLDEPLPGGVRLGGRLTLGRPEAAGHPGLDRAGQSGEALLDPEQGAHDAADEQRPQNDEHRRTRSDGRREGPVGDADAGQAGDEDGDQAETVRDHGAGPLREAVPDGHADEGPDDDGHDVDERPESRESGAHPRHPTGEAGPGRRRRPDPGLIPAQHVLI